MSDRPIDDDDKLAEGDELEGMSQLGAAATFAAGKDRAGRATRRGGSGGSRRLPKLPLGTGALLVLAAVLLFALVPTVSSGLYKTPRDRVGISYGGGPIEGSHFQRIVQPGSSLFFNGFFDPLYLYPADQQNYIISKVVGQGATKKADSVLAPTSDRVQVEYQVAAFFKLNTDRLRAFHEQLGLKYRAYTKSGWANLLQDTFRQQIEAALQTETRRYTVGELIGSAEALSKIQTAVQAAITQQLIAALGQQFFCGPTFTPGGKCDPITFAIKKIDIPPNVQAAYEDIARRTNEAKAIEILNVALSKAGENYVMLKAIENGSIKFWVIPQGTGVTLSTTDPTGPAPPAATTQGSGASSSTTTTTAPTTTTTTATTSSSP